MLYLLIKIEDGLSIYINSDPNFELIHDQKKTLEKNKKLKLKIIPHQVIELF